MLTPEMIDKMNKATGNNVPLDGSAPVQSRADQIRALGKSAAQAQQASATPQESSTPMNGIGGRIMSATQPIAQGVVNKATEFGKNVLADVSSRANDVGGAISGAIQKGGKGTSIGDAALQTGGAIAGGLTDIVGEGYNSIVPQPIKDLVAHVTSDRVKDIVQQVAKLTPEAQKQALSTMAAQNPDLIKDFGAVGNIIGTFTLPELGEAGGAALSGAKDLAQGGIAKAGAALDNSYLGEAKTAARTATKNDEFVKDLVTPKMTAKDMTAAIKTGKVTEGTGVFGNRDATGALPGFENVQSTVKEVPGISADKTLLENANAIHDHIATVANDLRSQIKAVQTQIGGDRGFFTPNELKGYMNGVMKTISENPTIVGNAEQTAQKILNKFSSLVKEQGYTPEGLLNARQELDKWMSIQKGTNIFDPTTENAVSTALRGIRQGANKFLASKIPSVAVEDLFAKQTSLYDAIENIAPKAAKEGANGFEQFVKAHPALVKAARFAINKAGIGAAVHLIP